MHAGLGYGLVTRRL